MISHLSRTLTEMIAKFKPGSGQIPEQDRQAGLELSIKVMALISVADGRIDEAEVKQVQEVYRSSVGGMILPETIERSFRIAMEEQKTLWRDIESTRDLDERVCKDIFDAAVTIAIADQELHEDEVIRIRRLGTALHLSSDYVEKLLTESG